MPKVAQRRVAGAEVVDRDPYAEASQILQVLPDTVVVAEQQALGDFQGDPVRSQAAVG